MAFKQVAFRIPEEYDDWLRKHSEDTDESQGYIVQQAICLLADSYKVRLHFPKRRDRGQDKEINKGDKS